MFVSYEIRTDPPDEPPTCGICKLCRAIGCDDGGVCAKGFDGSIESLQYVTWDYPACADFQEEL